MSDNAFVSGLLCFRKDTSSSFCIERDVIQPLLGEGVCRKYDSGTLSELTAVRVGKAVKAGEGKSRNRHQLYEDDATSFFRIHGSDEMQGITDVLSQMQDSG